MIFCERRDYLRKIEYLYEKYQSSVPQQVQFWEMHKIIELDLSLQRCKPFYRTLGNKLQLLTQSPPIDFPFNQLSYGESDTVEAILGGWIGRVAGVLKDHKKVPKEWGRQRVQEGQKMFRINLATQKSQKGKGICQFVVFDGVNNNSQAHSIIDSIQKQKIFCGKTLKIGHFLVHSDGIYDYHKQFAQAFWKYDNEPQPKQTIQSNQEFVFGSARNINKHFFKSLLNQIQYKNYINFKNNRKNIEKSLVDEAVLVEIQDRKLLEFFIIQIENFDTLVLVLLHNNKKYTNNCQQINQIRNILEKYHILMVQEGQLHKSHCQELKQGIVTTRKYSTMLKGQEPQNQFLAKNYQQDKFLSLKAKVIQRCLKWGDYGTYVIYFPNVFLSQMPKDVEEHPLMIQSPFKKKLYKKSFRSNRTSHQIKRKRINSQQIDITIQIGEKNPKSKTEQIKNSFQNYFSLVETKKTKMSKVDYLKRLYINLQNTLKDRKQSLQNTRTMKIQQEKYIKSLKMEIKNESPYIVSVMQNFHKDGIYNLQKYQQSLRLDLSQKKDNIKQIQKQIQQLYVKKISGKKAFQLFFSKLQKNKDLLVLKMKQKMKSQIFKKSIFTTEGQYEPSRQYNLDFLTMEDIDKIQHQKDVLSCHLQQRLKQCNQRNKFVHAMDQAQKTLSKDSFAKLKQKYYTLY